MIRTVLNDIEKEKLGVTMCHEHFIVDLDRVRHDGISMIETPGGSRAGNQKDDGAGRSGGSGGQHD